MVSWSPAVNGGFVGDTVYTATISLTPNSGYTMDGVAKNSFRVAGATSVSNEQDSGIITAVFPATDGWARSLVEGGSYSGFNAVATDAAGNTYAVGYVDGTGVFSFGNGVSVRGSTDYENPVIVKYDSRGSALWARTPSGGSGFSQFTSIAIDGEGNVYVGRYIGGTEEYTFSPGVIAKGTFGYDNVVLAKFNPSGTALWARTVNAGANYSRFNSVAVDGDGNVYACGYIS